MVLTERGALAQLARASAWHAEGHRFEPDMLHHFKSRNFTKLRDFFYFFSSAVTHKSYGFSFSCLWLFGETLGEHLFPAVETPNN